eukprot:86863_1
MPKLPTNFDKQCMAEIASVAILIGEQTEPIQNHPQYSKATLVNRQVNWWKNRANGNKLREHCTKVWKAPMSVETHSELMKLDDQMLLSMANHTLYLLKYLALQTVSRHFITNQVFCDHLLQLLLDRDDGVNTVNRIKEEKVDHYDADKRRTQLREVAKDVVEHSAILIVKTDSDPKPAIIGTLRNKYRAALLSLNKLTPYIEAATCDFAVLHYRQGYSEGMILTLSVAKQTWEVRDKRNRLFMKGDGATILRCTIVKCNQMIFVGALCGLQFEQWLYNDMDKTTQKVIRKCSSYKIVLEDDITQKQYQNLSNFCNVRMVIYRG